MYKILILQYCIFIFFLLISTISNFYLCGIYATRKAFLPLSKDLNHKFITSILLIFGFSIFYHLYTIWEFHKCGIYVFKNNNMSNQLQCFESINNFLTPIRFAYLLDNSIAGLSWVLSIDFDIFITFFLICQTFFVSKKIDNLVSLIIREI